MPSRDEKLLERMRQSQSGWKQNNLISVYEGFGFEIRHGRSHDIITHPDYPELRETLPRHSKIAKVYVKNAIKLIDQLAELQEAENKDD